MAVLREDVPGERRLMAYVTARGAAPLDAGELWEHLKSRLPEPMLPAAIVVLEELPVTPNGKVDRSRLPAPVPGGAGRAMADESSAGERPWSVAERTLEEIWREVLRVDRLGLNDRFLDLGGDSILSLQVASRARRAGLQLKARDVFEHPTLAELAAVAERKAPAAVPTGPAAGAVPLTPIQQWFFTGPRIDPNYFNQALLLAAGSLQVAALRRAIQAVTDHHDALRLHFERRDGTWRQEHGEPGTPAEVPWIDLTALPAAIRPRALEAVTPGLQEGFDISRGPLLRLAVFETGGEAGQRLLLLAHHLVIDGVSWRILLEDLETVYRQASVGESPRLPARTSSFQSWANRLVEEGRSPALAVEAEYWLALARTEVRPLPADTAGRGPGGHRRDRHRGARPGGDLGSARTGTPGLPDARRRPAARRPGRGLWPLDGRAAAPPAA